MTEGLSDGAAAPEPVRTGDPAIDDMLDSLHTLDDLPVDHHVAVFERAHHVLREALDTRPDS